MAFSQMQQAQDGGAVAFYNVDWAVGWGAPSLRVDTMLIQAMLHVFFYEQGGVAKSPEGSYCILPPPAGYTSVAVDGIAGSGTVAHITVFQHHLCQLGYMRSVDHRMDPMRQNLAAQSTIGRANYAIGVLNAFCNNGDPENVRFNLPERQDMPLALRSALKTVKTLADQYRAGSSAGAAGW